MTIPPSSTSKADEAERIERMARVLAANDGPHQYMGQRSLSYFDGIHPNWQEKYRRYAQRVLEAFDASA